MIRRFVAFILFASVFALVAPVSTAAAAIVRQPAVDPTLSRIVELVNVHRARAGLGPVTMNATLMNEAGRFSGVIAALGRIDHRGNDGSNAGQRLTRAGYRWGFYGENLAAGQENADAVVAAWMASPGHRAKIPHPRAVEIGVGHTFRDGDPSLYFDYWTMELGRRR